MDTFWDTSAVVPLLLREPHTVAAQAAWSRTTRPWAWRWLVIETEAALSRRAAPPAAWSHWAALHASLHLLDLESDRWDALRAFNRALHLRAADAAHLFVFERASTAVPGLQLVAFDAGLVEAARRIGLAVL
jgi:predicted nucleic acid-binding protein